MPSMGHPSLTRGIHGGKVLGVYVIAHLLARALELLFVAHQKRCGHT
jgi:hypothetical protein